MKKASAPFLALMLLFGVFLTTRAELTDIQQHEVISKITCKPGVDLQERPEIHIVDAKGNHRDAFRQWLILDDGKQKFRILWGSPPLSHGPVDLSSHQIYTFTISTQTETEHPVHTVLRILKGEKIIYDVTEKKNGKRGQQTNIDSSTPSSFFELVINR